MQKFAAVGVFVALVVAVNGFPTGSIADAAIEHDWEKVHQILSDFYRTRYGLSPLNEGNVKYLQPPPGGHVHAEADYQYHSATNDNGRVSEHSRGYKVINKDGEVTEYNYTPQRPRY